MASKNITITGARVHNLKNISLKIPRNKLVVITGLSGSGKSSLAFDTIYAEGKRRYVESLSTYARQFLNIANKPDVDSIEGLSPTIAIDQKTTSHNPRSTVGTITEIYDYLRLLFARVGEPRCPQHKISLKAQSVQEIVTNILKQNKKDEKWSLLAPLIKNRKGEHTALFSLLLKQGFLRVRINKEIFSLDELPIINKNKKYNIEAVVDRFKIKADMKLRITESVENALELSGGSVILSSLDNEKEILFSNLFACAFCEYSILKLEPTMFSFNSPAGACKECDGLGVQENFDEKLLIINDNLTLNQGAIAGWGPRNNYYFQLLKSVGIHFKIDFNLPYKKITSIKKNILIYGNKNEKIQLKYQSENGNEYKKKVFFEGIMNNLSRRYRDSESEHVKNELHKLMSIKSCNKCKGDRLNQSSLNVFIGKLNIADIVSFNVEKSCDYFKNLKLKGINATIAERILKEIKERMAFLYEVGLSYITLNREAGTLSGGEAQRIRLASQIGSGLVGVVYVLDEPSIGLHQKDNVKLLNTLKYLRDLGNTVIVVEHDEETIKAADYIVDIGPKSGIHGGEVVALGHWSKILNCQKSYTALYLSGKKKIIPPKNISSGNGNFLQIHNASGNNLKNINFKIPLGCFVCITGVSGSGKSTLITKTLYPLAAKELNGVRNIKVESYGRISGLKFLNKVIEIDQSPIGRTPRSNPATYTGIFTHVRDLFSLLPESRARAYKAGRFSFNVKGGRCENCRGDGIIKVEMHFMADVYVQCDICHGKRYNEETLQIFYKQKDINDVLSMTIEESYDFFALIPAIKNKIQTLIDVGLGYLTLGHSATHLSGGEAQRIKLAKELSKKDTGDTIYILDEPTTGLHIHDVKRLLDVLFILRNKGNSILVIEHNLDVIKSADFVVDLGPDGGDKGGEIIATGSPQEIAQNIKSITGKFLKKMYQEKSF